jgi:hypothetical protein
VDRETRERLHLIAANQRGLFSAAQAAEAGASYQQLDRAESSGELRRVRRGVYAWAGVAPSRWDRIVAAALAAGPSAVISHGSAATVHHFDFGATNQQTEISLPPGARSRLSGIVVHRSSDLSAADVVTKRGVQVTSPARTLLDLAGRLGPRLTEKLLDEGIIARRWTAAEVSGALSRARPNLAGRTILEGLLAHRLEAPTADSVLEARAFRALEPLRPFEPPARCQHEEPYAS